MGCTNTDVQIAMARNSNAKSPGAPVAFNRSRQDIFIAEIAQHGRPIAASKAAAVSYATTLAWRKAAPENAERYAEAQDSFVEYLERVAMERATMGQRQLKFHQGAPIMVENPETGKEEHYFEIEYDSKLLQLLLMAGNPAKYRPSAQRLLGDDAQLGLILLPAAIEDVDEWEQKHGQKARQLSASDKAKAITVTAEERGDDK